MTGRRSAVTFGVLAGATFALAATVADARRAPRRPLPGDSGDSAELDRAAADVREELARANATTLGAAGVVATVVVTALAALMAGGWTAARLPLAGQVTWWAGVATAVTGLVLLAAVLFPSVPAETPGRPAPTYWGQIACYAEDDLPALAVALTRLGDDPMPRVANLRRMAVRARIKWRRVRAALVVLAVSGGLLAVTTLVSVAL